ncbi:hypothetical protein ACNSOP_01015 [Aliarcobacter lanthieri]|uniref:hypothetical protein n=1 Tax=Aliarcobacter lanthieri TaxID=1355374 RepID=UPI003AAB2F32
MSNKKETSCKVASTAGKLLSSKSTSKSVKSVAGSALSQTSKTCTKSKLNGLCPFIRYL